MLNADTVTRFAIESILGLLQWMAPIIFPTKVMLRSLTVMLLGHARDKPHTFRLSPEARKHLHWWLKWSHRLNACPFHIILGDFPRPELSILTDASDWGIGAYIPHHQRVFSSAFDDMPSGFRSLRHATIAVREIFAVLVALDTWPDLCRQRRILIIVDNQPVKFSIQRLWSSSPEIMHYVREIAFSAVTHQFRYWIHWIPTDENTVADALSRNRWDIVASATAGARLQRDQPVFSASG